MSLDLEGGQRVGICGRTGSGKSTLLSCFFFLVNVTSGTVYIDGEDMTTIPRDKLHTALVTIPQQPLLVAGTVRDNCCLALLVFPRRSYRVGARAATNMGSDTRARRLGCQHQLCPLTETQRQRLCIGRALLQPGGIVILDEPTSGFDEDTG